MAAELHDDNSGQVSVVFARVVKAGHEAEYEAWTRELQEATRGFPGYRGCEVIRPADSSRGEYVSIFRFESVRALRAWESSELRRGALARFPHHAVGELRVHRVTGMEFWFTAAGAPTAPVRWRSALLIVVVVYALIQLFSPIAAALLPGVSPHLRLLLTLTVEVFFMTYVLMPWLTKLLRPWLEPKRRDFPG